MLCLPGPAGVSAVWSGSGRGVIDWLLQQSPLSSHLPVCEDHQWTCLSCCCCCWSGPERAAWLVEEMVRVWLWRETAVSDWWPSELWRCWEKTLKSHKGVKILASWKKKKLYILDNTVRIVFLLRPEWMSIQHNYTYFATITAKELQHIWLSWVIKDKWNIWYASNDKIQQSKHWHCHAKQQT